MTAAHDAAVTRLWGELSSSLRAWFRRRTGDEHVAEDLVQESFLRVHDRLAEVRDEERLAAWIRGIARNLLVDWRRGRREQTGDQLGDQPAEPSDPAAPTDELANLDQVVASWLEPTIEELEESDRSALRLTELDGLPQQDAADRLGISLPALKSRVLRGRARLRNRIEACCELEFDRRGGIVDYRKRASGDCDPGC